jgi:predicted ferric reductase
MLAARAILIWTALAVTICFPLVLAATSPFHAWRSPAYIVGGFAGIVALCLMLIQPLLARGWLPGIAGYRGRRIHQWTGIALVAAVALHVVGLGIASPPDMFDALLFASPTAFSVWGVVAMWTVFASGLLAAVRRRSTLTPRIWRRAHMILAGVIVISSVIHGLLIEGTMEVMSKIALCVIVVAAVATAATDRRLWKRRQ